MSRPPLSMSQAMQVLEAWAVRKNLGDELSALAKETLYAQTMLDIASSGKETGNPSLDALLLLLQLVVQDAYAVLNELDYFHVQDQLRHGTSRGVDVGCFGRLRFHARAAAAILKPSSSSRHNAEFVEKLASVDPSSTCCVGNGRQVQDLKKAPKPKFNRVVLSTKITKIVEKLSSLSAKVSTIVELKFLAARSAP